jgi:hypothetical protein
MVKVGIEVPDGIVEFLKEHLGYGDEEVQEYVEESVQHKFGADWDVFNGGVVAFQSIGDLIDKYKLRSTPILAHYIKEDYPASKLAT